MNLTDNITITDNSGFVRDVLIEHWPESGISIAYYQGKRIAQREYGKFLPPSSDNDLEWEQWEERFRNWISDSISDLKEDCKKEFQ